MKKELGIYSIMMAFFYIIFGIIMLINPKFICDAINYITGSAIIVLGGIYLLKLLQNKKIKEFSKLELLIGLFAIGFGIFLILNSTLLVSILPLIVGIILFLDSFSQISNSFKLKRFGKKLWYINLLVGFIFLGCAIYIIINSREVSYLIIRVIGSILIFDGIFEIYTYFCLREISDDKKIIEAQITVSDK